MRGMIQAVSLSQIRDLMRRYGFFPRKKWGQNFLIDGNILNKIVTSCNLNRDTYVIEIGPGLGTLTTQLAENSRGVLAIDIDRDLEVMLQEVLAEYTNVQLLFANILDVNLEEELIKAFALPAVQPYQVCANIPYNITTPIIFYLLEKCPHLQSATLMMQKEVAQRIMASPGGKDYGLLTLTTSYYADSEFMMNVSRNCFYPRPEVDSAVLRITPRQERIQVNNEIVFKKLMRFSFQKRRKTMLNICTDFSGQDKNQMRAWLEQWGISPWSRPENLSLDDFILLANNLPLQEA
jgi:16S rRNA (adenine1518-N6/adenine1519-N6)-dimethyltransferase